MSLLLALLLLAPALAMPAATAHAEGPAPDRPWQQPWDSPPRPPKNFVHFLPYQSRAALTSPPQCATIPDATFEALSVLPPPTDRPAAQHADLNLGLRGYQAVEADKGYIWIGGPTDAKAPKLAGLFEQPRQPNIVQTFQVFDWDWECNCAADLITTPEVSLATFSAKPLETLHVPASGYGIGDGYEVLVLYAEPTRITLKYTRDDNVVSGYTLHIEDICVESRLVALYESLNKAGRHMLPALRAGQAFARAQGNAVGVAIRDTGRFMDPRSSKDWW